MIFIVGIRMKATGRNSERGHVDSNTPASSMRKAVAMRVGAKFLNSQRPRLLETSPITALGILHRQVFRDLGAWRGLEENLREPDAEKQYDRVKAFGSQLDGT